MAKKNETESKQDPEIVPGTTWKQRKGKGAGRAVDVVSYEAETESVIVRDRDTGKDSSMQAKTFLDRFERMTEEAAELIDEPDTDDPDELKRRLRMHQEYRRKELALIEARRQQIEKQRKAKNHLTECTKGLQSIEDAIAELIEGGVAHQRTIDEQLAEDGAESQERESIL